MGTGAGVALGSGVGVAVGSGVSVAVGRVFATATWTVASMSTVGSDGGWVQAVSKNAKAARRKTE